MSNKEQIYYKANKYHRVLRDKLAIFIYLFFQYGGEIQKVPSEYFRKISREEFKEWFEKIQDMSLKDYLTIPNVEDRRVILSEYLNTEKGKKEMLDISTLLSTETLNKRTWWYDKNAEKEVTYQDVYSLYMVEIGNLFTNNHSTNVLETTKNEDTLPTRHQPRTIDMENEIGYIVLCKDTSTDRSYMLWVDMKSILETNYGNTDKEDNSILQQYLDIVRQSSDVESLKTKLKEFLPKYVGAVDAIAWTIMTRVPENKIRKIIRQGDCILVDADIKDKSELGPEYHLSRAQYLKYMYKES